MQCASMSPLLVLLVAMIVTTRGSQPATMTDQAILQEGQDILTEFYARYNSTPQVDLVFVLDRSNSVERKGWSSMLNFVQDILEHFTVNANNTRVAIVSFSTKATVDINDVPPGIYTDMGNKCTLNRRINDILGPKVPNGYTATYQALYLAHNILLDSRSNSKKAVFVLTDGKSNIGDPPVKMAFDIMSLKWNTSWDEELLGPQVEIYAFGIEKANMEELRSMASDLPNHVFLIPKFALFEQLARSLHGDQQEEVWQSAQTEYCGVTCGGHQAFCMCGAKVGQYACGCGPGYERIGLACEACREGYYKSLTSPDPCVKCPVNTTTEHVGATSYSDCQLLPGLRDCGPLPDISHGNKFFVAGTRRDEVLDTGKSCDGTTDGNSCHYACEEGYRLSGSPIMICNDSGIWEGEVPTCNIIDCEELLDINWEIPFSEVTYINDTTTFGSFLEISCTSNRVPLGATTWLCGKHGRWTKPRNFQCAEVHCSALPQHAALVYHPQACGEGKQPLHQNCSFSCTQGFNLTGPTSMLCSFEQQATWLPALDEAPSCIDVEPPVIQCPPDLEVQVADWGKNSTIIYYDTEQPLVTDNSGIVNHYTVLPEVKDYVFRVGNHQLKYMVTDAAGNVAEPCYRTIHVKRKEAEILFCPSDIEKISNDVRGIRRVTWDPPVFLGPDNTTMGYQCNPASGQDFHRGSPTTVTCFPTDYFGVQCKFQVTVRDPECPIPFLDQKPKHGALGCTSSDTHFPKVCRIHCKKGYELHFTSPSKVWKCGWDGKWDIDEPWPDCYETFNEQETLIKEGLHILYEGRCEEKKEELKAAFNVTIQKVLLTHHAEHCQQGKCSITDVQVHCGDRSKRSIREKREAEKVTEEVSINFVLSVFAVADDDGVVTRDQQMTAMRNLKELHWKLAGDLQDTSLIVEDAEASVQKLQFLTKPGFPPLNCSEGSVEVTGQDEAACVTCTVGTHYSNGTCQPCPLNTYQDEEGQMHCADCPDGTYTLYRGARNITQCRAPCLPGHHSPTGYDPCEPCDLGSFQPLAGATNCTLCEAGYSTQNKGASSEVQCTEECPPNTFSPLGGVMPCSPCPFGQHQPSPRQQSCELCRPYSNSKFCPVVVNCSASDDCSQHGSCAVRDGKIACLCNPGFSGAKCEENLDECVGVRCENNGTCHDGVNEYWCECRPGYTGRHCDIALNPCDSSPCLHGYCVNHHHSYECVCSDGWSGETCQKDIDECQSNPCHHGNCSNEVNQYTCTCEPYFTGSSCDVLVDLCSSWDCSRKGVCVMAPRGPRCQCQQGRTGESCESKIDFCAEASCLKKGTLKCHSFDNGYECQCKSGYGGTHCEKEVSPFFDLVFPPSSTTDNFVMMRRPLRNLYQLTVAVWIRTRDVNNFGTIVSYATEKDWMNRDIDNSNILTLYDYTNLQLFINGEMVRTNISLNDGWWHHLLVAWDRTDGDWHVYVNATMAAQGTGLARRTFIQDRGYLVIGQEQDSIGGGFNERESFVGELSQLNVYDHVLSYLSVRDLAEARGLGAGGACRQGAGNVLTWSEVVGHVYGRVKVRNASHCLDVNECELPGVHNCSSDMVCEDTLAGFKCVPCSAEYKQCQKVRAPDPCRGVVCQNGGSCQASQNQYSCQCAQYYTGAMCEIAMIQNPHDCLSNPCLHGGTCHNVDGTVVCTCPPGYDGTFCELISDPCATKPCQNHGICKSLGDSSFTCACLGPWRGPYCHIRYQPKCENNPCLSGGTCVAVETESGYRCECPSSADSEVAGYGPNCELPTPCDAQPCHHNGTCIVLGPDQYLCVCMEDFLGSNCEKAQNTAVTEPSTTPVNHCLRHQCENGATCVSEKNHYRCECDVAYRGQHCQTLRSKEISVYQAVVTLDMPYDKGLSRNKDFLQYFEQQILKLYRKPSEESKITVSVNSITKGSVVMNFTLTHEVYGGQPARSADQMDATLKAQLQQGRLGEYKASLDNYQFIKLGQDAPEVVTATTPGWLYAVIVVLAVVLIALVVGCYVIVQRRRQAAKPMVKFNNHPDVVRYRKQKSDVDLGITEDESSGIYAECTPYAATSSTDIENRNNTGLELSERNRLNIKNELAAARQNIPLPPAPGELPQPPPLRPGVKEVDSRLQATLSSSTEYLAPTGGTPPPSYRKVMEKINKVDNRNLTDAQAAKSAGDCGGEDAYFTPLSLQEEAALLAKKSNLQDEAGNVNGSFEHEDDMYLAPRAMRQQSDHTDFDDHEYKNVESPTKKRPEQLTINTGLPSSSPSSAPSSPAPIPAIVVSPAETDSLPSSPAPPLPVSEPPPLPDSEPPAINSSQDDPTKSSASAVAQPKAPEEENSKSSVPNSPSADSGDAPKPTTSTPTADRPTATQEPAAQPELANADSAPPDEYLTMQEVGDAPQGSGDSDYLDVQPASPPALVAEGQSRLDVDSVYLTMEDTQSVAGQAERKREPAEHEEDS